MRKIISVSLFVFLSVVAVQAQRTTGKLNMSGTVLGYEHDPAKGIFKKEKTAVEGNLSGVKIELKEDGKTIKSVRTNNGGKFAISVPIGKKYELFYTKSEHAKSAFEIDLRNIPDDLGKTGLLIRNIELILNSLQTDEPIDKGEVFGRIYYDQNKRRFFFDATEFEKKTGLFQKERDDTAVKLIESALEKNKNNNTKAILPSTEDDKTEDNILDPEDDQPKTVASKSKTISLLKRTQLVDDGMWENLTETEIEDREKEIENAWKQLESDRAFAVSEEDFLLLKAREELLIAAENELAVAKEYIQEQEAKLNAQRNILIVSGIAGILLIAFVFFLLKVNKEKKKHNRVLAAKNKKIADSINYAERIQQSVFFSEEQVKSILPNAFIFHLPRDVVSGDFYWFSEVNGKVILAAVDCTGHGVPGAFMSLIGNTLLNQIVNEKKIDQPSEILKHLHYGIVESLQQGQGDTSAQDGMDLAVCSIDKKANKLYIAGAMNPVYIVHNGEVEVISGDLKGIGGLIGIRDPENVTFSQHEYPIKKDSSIYLFSDGYMDQFGGENDEKFNVPRFKSLITSIYNTSPEEQKKSVEQTMLEWKGSGSQIDDILVIGVKF
ncbi:MAG: SpoIIE family protein phosphatase [Crocinitomicaceae bacterium]